MKKTRLIPIALLVTLMLFSCATTGKESIPVKEEITFTEAEAPRSEDTPEVVEPKEAVTIIIEEEKEEETVSQEPSIIEIATAESVEPEVESIETIEEESIVEAIPDSFKTVDPGDVISLFSYAYGYKTMEDIKAEGISVVSSYFLRGIYDAVLSPIPTLMKANEIESYIQSYVRDYYSSGETFLPGDRPEGIAYILSLEPTFSIPEAFSYAYAFTLIRDLVDGEVDIMSEEFMTGVLDSIYSSEPLLDQRGVEEAIAAYIDYLNQEYLKEVERMGADNSNKASSFLEENGKKEGIETLENGIQMETLDEDDILGDHPTQYDTVLVDYNVYVMDYETEDLEIIDADYYAELRLIEIDSAMRDSITALRTGMAARFWIPPELLYGERNIEGIEPNSIVVFDIALHEIL